MVDKRITARWLAYERVDTAVGTSCSRSGRSPSSPPAPWPSTARRSTAPSQRRDRGRGLPARGGLLGRRDLFALALLNGSLLGAGVVTLSTSYAVGDVTGTKHSLHRGWRDARLPRQLRLVVALAAAIVAHPRVPLGVVTTAVQALAGVLLPSALVFLLLLCNDRAVLGPRTNPRWLNVVTAAVVASLLVLSGLLVASTLFSRDAVGWAAILASRAAPPPSAPARASA